MDTPLAKFDGLVEKYLSVPGVAAGNMMSSPGLKYKGRVFAFYYRDKMGFRLGLNFDPKKHGITKPQLLSPFKTKPPLKGWYLIDKHEMSYWESLTDMALTFTRTIK